MSTKNLNTENKIPTCHLCGQEADGCWRAECPYKWTVKLGEEISPFVFIHKQGESALKVGMWWFDTKEFIPAYNMKMLYGWQRFKCSKEEVKQIIESNLNRNEIYLPEGSTRI